MELKAKSEWDLNEMSRDELVYIWKTFYKRTLSDLSSGYVSAKALREAIASELEAEKEGVASTTSSFEFVDIEEAEAIDEDAEYEWYTAPGSSARQRRRKT